MPVVINRKTRLYIRWFLVMCITLVLLLLAWEALAGAVRQFPRSMTIGQQIETVVQFICGLLTLGVVLTCFIQREWAAGIRLAWIVSLVLTAGLSSLVWGPPMLLITLLLSSVALVFAWGIVWALKRLCQDEANDTGK